jgi:hypothetical protein
MQTLTMGRRCRRRLDVYPRQRESVIVSISLAPPARNQQALLALVSPESLSLEISLDSFGIEFFFSTRMIKRARQHGRPKEIAERSSDRVRGQCCNKDQHMGGTFSFPSPLPPSDSTGTR